MSQELVVQPQNGGLPQRNVALGAGANVGSVAIEQERAIAEAQGQLILAKKFPRDENAAHADMMKACKMPAFAAAAFYSVPRAGGAVTGASIRLAEEIARCYGNFSYGHRELSRDGNKSEVEVYAWDKERNNESKRQITVFHVRDTKDGPKVLRDQKDIDDKIANVASKQVRGRILALIPKWMLEEAIQECRKTIAGNNDEPIEVRVRKMTQAFAKYGVTVAHLERYLGHALGETLADEIVDLTGVFNSIKDGTRASEFFGVEQQAEKSEQTAAAIAASAAPAPAAEAAPAKPKATPRAASAKPPAAAAVAEESKPAEKESMPAEASNAVIANDQPQPDDPAPADAEVGGAQDDVF